MKKIAVLAAALVVMGAAQAQSKSPLYGELGYTFTKVSSDGVDFNPGVLRGMLGYEVNPYLALEAMYGTSLSDDSTSIDGVTVKAEVERTYGFYIKPKYAIGSGVELFARLGYADSKVKLKVPSLGASASDSDNDFSFGLGLNYAFSRNVYMSADYMSYYNKDGVKADGFTLGVGYKF